MTVRRVAAAAAALTLFGCESLPGPSVLGQRLERARDAELAPTAEVEVPVEWIAEAPPAPPRGDWVGAFEDETLAALVAEAEAANPTIAAAVARAEQVAALARIAQAQRLPSVSADSRAGVSSSVIDAADPIRVESSSLSWGLQASWDADLWGRLRDSAKAGRLDAVASAEDLADAQLSITGAVANGWFNLLGAVRDTALAADDVATLRRQLSLTERRFERGVAQALDVRLARSAVASAEASFARAENAEREAARRLEVLLGRYPSAELERSPNLPALPLLTGAGVPADLLTRRPDVRAAELRLEASGLRVGEARKALLPRLTLSASAGPSSDALGELFDPDYIAGSLFAGLAGPIFQGGAIKADIAQSEAAARERLAAYVGVLLEAWREVESALDAEANLAAQEAALTVAAEEARAAETLAERDYANGILASAFELLDAQRRRIGAERSLIDVQVARLTNRVQLHLALGGDAVAAEAPTSEGG